MRTKPPRKNQYKPTQKEQIKVIDRTKARDTASKLMKKYDQALRELAKR